MLPLIEEIAHDLGERALIVKIDASKMKDIAQQYNVVSVPTLIGFKHGKEVQRSDKAMNKGELQSFFEKVL